MQVISDFCENPLFLRAICPGAISLLGFFPYIYVPMSKVCVGRGARFMIMVVNALAYSPIVDSVVSSDFHKRLCFQFHHVTFEEGR